MNQIIVYTAYGVRVAVKYGNTTRGSDHEAIAIRREADTGFFAVFRRSDLACATAVNIYGVDMTRRARHSAAYKSDFFAIWAQSIVTEILAVGY